MKLKVLPVFIPFAGCKNRCIYCDQAGITGIDPQSAVKSAEKQIKMSLSYTKNWDEIAFYGGSFTCLDEHIRKQLYRLAYTNAFRRVRISTDPGCIYDELLDEARGNFVKTIELGVQSLSDTVLAANRRPCSSKVIMQSVEKVQERFNLGVQIMTGMYGEGWGDFRNTVDRLCSTGAVYARIYPTVVLEGTELYTLMSSGAYEPLTPAETIRRALYAYTAFENRGITVIRTGLHSDADFQERIKGGFYHPAMGDLVKTAAMLLYCSLGYVLEAPAGKIQGYFGYKCAVRRIFPESIRTADRETGLKEICEKVQEAFCEDNSGELERKIDYYTQRLLNTPYHG
ncbi:radical SAM protein [Limisalsivibrio acetivorans]|uniref:radical SAM protein n=1 Tax=Limisalsivibrio acetivorans TaxID=1304888 RepID=UPI0003B423F3|nr:radical SAM protein [Limisalsivibrio acetivorans]